MDKQLIKEFNLPKYISGKTFAEASKSISKKFDERTDPQAQKTKEELLERLAEAQEYVKMQEEAKTKSMQSSMNNNANNVEDQMNGEIPEGMKDFMPKEQSSKFAMGGPIDPPDDEKTKAFTDAYSSLQTTMDNYPPISEIDDLETLKKGFRNHLWLSRNQGNFDKAGMSGSTSGLTDNNYKTELYAGAIENMKKKPASEYGKDFKKGGLIKRKDGSYSKKGLWDNIRDNKGSGKTPTPEMLEQEKKINYKLDGGLLNSIQEAAGGKGEAMQTVDGVQNSMKGNSSIMGKAGSMGKAGAYMGGASQLMDMGKDIFGDTGIDTSGNGKYQKEINEGGAAASGALKGASTGAQIGGPWGAAIGGVVGGVGSLFGSKAKNKDIEEANINKDLSVNSKLSNNTFSKGGYTNKYEKGGKFDTSLTTQGINFGAINRALAENTVGDNLKQGIKKGNTPEIKYTSLKGKTNDSDLTNDSNLANAEDLNKSKEGSKVAKFAKKYGADIGRITPTVFNLIQAGNLDEAEKVRRSTLDNKYDPQYMDINQMINKVDQNNVNKALSEASGGDMGALRSNILAANLNKDKAKSDAFIQADQINRRENDRKQQFDTNIDKLNLNQANADLVDNMQNRGARETTKNNLLSSAMTDIGKMSKEAQDRKIAASATGYYHDGEFITNGTEKIDPKDLGLTKEYGNLVDKDGNKISDKKLQELIKNMNNGI